MAKETESLKLGAAKKPFREKFVKPNPADNARPGIVPPVSGGSSHISVGSSDGDIGYPKLDLPPGVKDPLGPRIRENVVNIRQDIAAGKVNAGSVARKTNKK